MPDQMMIAPFKTGLSTDLSPWISQPDSFRTLNNFDIHHGYIEKRAGYRKYGYMAHASCISISGITQANPGVVTTSAAHGLSNGQTVLIQGVVGMTEVNNLTFTVANVTSTTFELSGVDTTSYTAYSSGGCVSVSPIVSITGITQASPGVVTAPGHGFSNSDQVIITNVAGMTEVNGTIFTVANRTASTFELSGVDTSGYTAYSSGGAVALYVGDRIMGINNYVDSTGALSTLAFDTQRAAIYDTTNDRFNPLDNADIMDGADTDYIWTVNWQATGGNNRLYFTNGKVYDGSSLNGIRYYDGVTSTAVTTLFNPTVSTTGSLVLYGAKHLFAMSGRLIALGVYENSTYYPQRMIWCKFQTPDTWDRDNPGGGGFVDAATGEHIVSARQISANTIIVLFTNSVWSITTRNDPALPFVWQKLNDFRGCGGKMASTTYDRYVFSVGVRGIVASNGSETARIDDRIQDFVSDELNVEEFGKVFCIRDYANKRAWTLYPDGENTENTKALVLDEDTSAFSQYTISMNCLGYGISGEDYGLDDFTASNDLDITISQSGEDNLQDYFWQQGQEILLGGDTSGIVYIMSTGGSDDGTDISCEAYTNAWNPYISQGKEARMQYLDLYVDANKNTLLTFDFYKDTDVSPYESKTIDLLPNLGFIAPVTNITQANPAQVTAPSHGLSTGDVIYIYGVQGMTEISDGYTITVVDDDNFTLDGIDSSSYTAYTTGGSVVRREFYKVKIWKRVLAGGIGFQHRVKITNTGSNTSVRMDAFKPVFEPIGDRVNN